MTKRVSRGVLPRLYIGDVIFARFRLQVSICSTYVPWFLSTCPPFRFIYKHVALVISNYDPQPGPAPGPIVVDVVKWRHPGAVGTNKRIRKRDLGNLLEHFKPLHIGRLGIDPIDPGDLYKITSAADTFATRDIDYSMSRYKCPDSIPPSFSCYGFVEYCYELVDRDLVAEDRFVGAAKILNFIPKFRPGHQFKAFKKNRYAFKGNSVL